MEPQRPLSPGALDEVQTPRFLALLSELYAAGFAKSVAFGEKQRWINLLGEAFPDAAGYSALEVEIRRWIYWTRIPGYWLGYLLQEFAKERFPERRYMASLLYATAEECVGDADNALATLELTYHDARLNELPDELLAPVVERLAQYHRFYRRWSQPGTLYGANPLLEHPYHRRSWLSLRTAFPALPAAPADTSVQQLEDVAVACETDGMQYYLPVARRWLATALSDAHRAAEAAEVLGRAIRDASVVSIEQLAILPVPIQHDAELGHLHRLRGETLGSLGRLEEAEAEHAAGLAHEDSLAMCSYWRALSAKELGKVRLLRSIDQLAAGLPVEPVLDAYRAGREALDLHLMITPSPIVRAAVQQLLRQMSDPMIDLAVNVGRPADALAEIESLGPHAAADALGELLGASQSGTSPDLRSARAVFHRHLTTVPEDFGEYLAAIPAEREVRRVYRATRNRPDVVAYVSLMLSSSLSAKRVVEMRIPNASLAMFHVGEAQGRIVVVDLEDDARATFDPPEPRRA